jgi:transposase-like protein
MKCPHCNAEVKQYKAGYNWSGSQRYRCGVCKRAYTPEPKPLGYPADMQMLAVRMYLEGNSQRAIGRILQVSQQSVANWIQAYVESLPAELRPEKVHTAELDELYTFIGNKKTGFTSLPL